MSKLSYVTDNLHRIGDEIANVSHSADNAGSEKTPETLPEEKKEDLPLDRASYFELLNLRRELQAKLEENVSFYSSRAELLRQELGPVQVSAEKMHALLEAFEKLPDCENVNNSSFRFVIGEYEKLRLEIFRAEDHAEKLRMKREGSSVNGTKEVDLSKIPAGVLLRKGFVFFLPLLLGGFVFTLLLAFAFVAAWKMAF